MGAEAQVRQRRWFEVEGVETLPSPCLLVYRDRLEHNLRRMIEIVRDPARLRPHIKTYKIREIVARQLELGITKFKCATIAEAEMAAQAGVPDLLLAYQPVGPNVARLAGLVKAFPKTRFSALGDDALAINELSRGYTSSMAHQGPGSGKATRLEVLLDLDLGQQRTGVAPGPKAVELYRLLAALPGLAPGGLHAYDGQIVEADPARCAAACEAAFAPVVALKRELESIGLSVPRIVAGGTPTFPIHARRAEVECSPGTCVFWDAGYSHKLPEMGFLPAAAVLTRVISRPAPNRLCVDLGHKAVGSEMPQPRVEFLNLLNAKPLTHSEEHLVLETAEAAQANIGECLYGLPWHICPTVALHGEAVVVENHRPVGRWRVAARDRCLTI
jgi:D-serine deaminase-like pyridoxal phosphate-dependent protein